MARDRKTAPAQPTGPTRREFFKGALAAALTVAFVQKIGFAPEIKVFWKPGGMSALPGDPFEELTFCGWKTTIDGKKYGHHIVLNEMPEDKTQIEAIMRDHARRSIAQIEVHDGQRQEGRTQARRALQTELIL